MSEPDWIIGSEAKDVVVSHPVFNSKRVAIVPNEKVEKITLDARCSLDARRSRFDVVDCRL